MYVSHKHVSKCDTKIREKLVRVDEHALRLSDQKLWKKTKIRSWPIPEM